MWRGAFLAFPVGLIALFVYLFFHLGAHKSVSVTIEEQPLLKVIYKDHQGAYYKISGVITEVENWAKSQGLSCTRSFGEYLDNPEATDEDRLRSRGGCILDNEAPPAQSPYTLAEIPAGRFVTARFSGSPAIGPFKVYPSMNERIAEEHLLVRPGSIEIYDTSVQPMLTLYLMRLQSH